MVVITKWRSKRRWRQWVKTLQVVYNNYYKCVQIKGWEERENVEWLLSMREVKDI